MSDKWKSAFDQIHAEDELIEHTKEYLSQRVYRRKTAQHHLFRRFSMAAAGLAALFFIGGSWIFLTPTAYISIDINPSLELGINRFDRIVFVESYNEDGEDLAESLDVTFMDYNDALEEILSDQSIGDYLSQDALMSLTVAGDDEAQYSEILDTVEACASGRKNIRCHSGSTDEMHEAHDAGVSFGKYRAYLILKDLDPSVSLDDVRDLTMREIYDLIDSYSGDQGSGNTASETNGAGSDQTGAGASNSNRGAGSRHNTEHRGNGSGSRHGGRGERETE